MLTLRVCKAATANGENAAPFSIAFFTYAIYSESSQNGNLRARVASGAGQKLEMMQTKKYKNQVEENEAVRIARNEERRSNSYPQNMSTQNVRTRGAVLAEVWPDSIAEELGLQPGATITHINEEPLRDAIQLKMADASEAISLTVVQNGAPQIFDIEKDAFEPLGIHVDAELFDGVTRCQNKCPFCFVDQLPPRFKNGMGKNLRRTLYVRDDDYRLSFLHGHYITLTNLKDEDYARIIEEKLSPLCVSVQATDPSTRIKMLGNKTAGNIIERLEFLIANGIQINAQIVLCPGINDREQLDRSVRDLMNLWPGVESMAVVPVGLTKFMPDNRGMRVVEPHEAKHILEQLKPYQRECRKKFGTNFVYASDEMYLLAGEEFPRAAQYDGYPQYANGVGTMRHFLDEVQKLRRKRVLAPSANAPKITLVTGSLAAPALRELAAVLNEKKLAQAEVAEIKNTFWGGNVACAGLLMGQEILSQLRGRDCGEYVFLPPDAVDSQSRMLDDITLADMSTQLGVQVRCDANGPLQVAQFLLA
jgi:putative radical SAM enzyme (TIGR03279 family)